MNRREKGCVRTLDVMPGWKTKAALQRVLSSLPGGDRLNYLLQRRLTHGLPISDERLREVIAIAAHHVESLRVWSPIPISEGRFFEFGAGWDLHVAQTLYCLGVDRQIVIDIRSLLKPSLVVDVRDRLATGPGRSFLRTPPTADPMPAYLAATGIEYRAPCDARSTGLPSGSIDFITSTDTLEHIPVDDIRQILTECRRILSDDGAMSFQIDYRDHYSYFDQDVSAYNFLRYDTRAWRPYNSALHHQNRLRHRDYVELFSEAGFDVVAAEVITGTSDDEVMIRDLEPATPFRSFSLAELAVKGASLVLRKDGPGGR